MLVRKFLQYSTIITRTCLTSNGDYDEKNHQHSDKETNVQLRKEKRVGLVEGRHKHMLYA